MKKRIVIVDDHQLIAKAISMIIQDFIGFEVMYEVENGKALIEKLKAPENIPDIILLDVSMPIMNGFETALWLKENNPEILVMALSVQDDDTSLIRMIQNGAKGYLHKNVHPNELEQALNFLVRDKVYFPAWAASKVFSNMTKPSLEKEVNTALNAREEEFLKLVCLDLTYKEIADKMCLSPRTIEGYRDSLFEKLEIHNRVGLALYAVKNGYHVI